MIAESCISCLPVHIGKENNTVSYQARDFLCSSSSLDVFIVNYGLVCLLFVILLTQSYICLEVSEFLREPDILQNPITS